jgi:hypothetical protein
MSRGILQQSMRHDKFISATFCGTAEYADTHDRQ